MQTTAEEFVPSVLSDMMEGAKEVAYGNASRSRTLSLAQLDELFERMNP